MVSLIPTSVKPDRHRIMVFADGENLAFRFGDELGKKDVPTHVRFKPEVYVWSYTLAEVLNKLEIVRKYYFTGATGAVDALFKIEDELRTLEIEKPIVFKRSKQRQCKRVDIALSTEILLQAVRDNFDVAILATGDEDFVPVVEAVMSLGKRVVLWSLSSGLSRSLARACDYSADLSPILLADRDESRRKAGL
jgi:uncharacterized LabA/DUF88 family protein